MEIKELWKLVNAKVERQKAERLELSTLRSKLKQLRELKPTQGQILKPSEIRKRWEAIWEVLK